MDKKQEIKGIANVLKLMDETSYSTVEQQAKYLYIAGYRKASDLLVEIENLKEVNQALQNENYNLELNLSHIEEAVKKETAREIIKSVEDFIIDNRIEEVYQIMFKLAMLERQYGLIGDK